MKRFERAPSGNAYVAAAAIAAIVFLVDWRTELGIAVWVFYLAPVALTAFGWRPLASVVAAAVATALLVIGYFLSPDGAARVDIAQLNRSFGAATLWIVAGLVWHSVRTKLEIAEQDWIRAGQAALAEAMQGELEVEEAAARAVRMVCERLGAPAAALYLVDAEGLRLAAATGTAGAPARLAPGEGLAGRAARDVRLLRVADVPAGYFTAASALGAASPGELLVLPAVADGVTVAVLEVGLFRAAYESDVDFLDAIGRTVALTLRSAIDRARLRALLDETQRQAEELQQQQEELRVANEELADQGEALKASQAQLEAQHADLERTNAQLELQATELERASRYKSEFLARMSHELRTPLNSILILAKLLADDERATAEQARWARAIASAGDDLLALIHDVLDLSRIEAGRLEIRPERVRLSSLLAQVERTFLPVAAERRLAFERAVDPGAPETIVTDPVRVQQILSNLLSNAFKFTERGSVSLRVSAGEEGGVEVEVRDTGIGIAPEHQQSVFEAFQQVETGTSRKYGGTGLGLSISRDLARLLGGTLSLESAPGVGSTFTLALPARVPGSAPAERPAPGERPPRPTVAVVADAPPAPAAARPRTILVIEDDARFAGLLCELATAQGFECSTVRNADEGVEAAVRLRPSAILLDIGLPDHSGLTVLERLKRNPDTRHIPVHVVSGLDETRTALEMGAVGYTVKPVGPDELRAVLERLDARLERRIRRVLVVEDDARQRESVTQLLSGAGVEIVGAATMADALAKLRAEPFDCAVVDLALPDGSGFELVERMGAEEGASFPPVIVYTGRALTADEETRLRRRSSSIIVKGARSPERLLDEVTLFLHRVESELPEERRRMLRQARGRDAAFEGRRLLLVEDDVRNVFALSAVLEPRGAKVEIARNGREALEALQAGPPPDLVLMDIMMPEMDGYEAMRRIRADPRLAKLPIIALTARAMKDDQERVLAAGANDYVAKPIDVDKLLSLVRVWLPR